MKHSMRKFLVWILVAVMLPTHLVFVALADLYQGTVTVKASQLKDDEEVVLKGYSSTNLTYLFIAVPSIASFPM